MGEELSIPRRVTIETLYGCNYECVFCPISLPSKRKNSLMTMDMYKHIIDDLRPYAGKIEILSLFGLGEPLLDKYIFDRVKYAKDAEFPNVGFNTNAEILDEVRQKKLLDSGIDAVSFSIDGINKETHEKLRRGSHYDRVISNTMSTIEMRNKGDYKTRLIIRFIKQPGNEGQWEEYNDFWSEKLSSERGDLLISYNLHSWAGQMYKKDDILGKERISEIEAMPCHHYTDILYILSDGTVPLCHEDNPDPMYIFGNIKEQTPIEIFNSRKRKAFNKLHEQGKKNNLERCRNCTILYSEKGRVIDELLV